MRVEATNGYNRTSPLRPRPAQHDGKRVDQAGKRPAGRSLVILANQSRSVPTPKLFARPAATFVAHLIATALGAPQTRARRRAEPGEAKAVYAAMSTGGERAGRVVSRSV